MACFQEIVFARKCVFARFDRFSQKLINRGEFRMLHFTKQTDLWNQIRKYYNLSPRVLLSRALNTIQLLTINTKTRLNMYFNDI